MTGTAPAAASALLGLINSSLSVPSLRDGGRGRLFAGCLAADAAAGPLEGPPRPVGPGAAPARKPPPAVRAAAALGLRRAFVNPCEAIPTFLGQVGEFELV